MDYQLSMVVLGLAGALVCCALLFRSTFNRYHAQIRERIARLPVDDRVFPAAAAQDAAAAAKASTFAVLLPTREADLQLFRERLARAGITSPAALSVFFVVRLFGLVLPAVVGWAAVGCGAVSMKQGTFGGVICGCLGYMLPNLWLDWCASKRQLLLRRGIPDFLDLMVVCLESGLSLAGTLQRVGEEINIAHPLLAAELGIMQHEITLGASIDRAFRNFADRTGLDAVRTLSTFIRESQRFGSELVEAFRSQADVMRYQREQHAEEQAQKASVKILFPMLLLILPAVFIVLAGPAAIQIQEAFAH